MYSESKDLDKRTISDKILKDGAYEIGRNRNYDGYQRALASMVHEFFDKKAGLGVSVNEQLAVELHKPVIKIFKIRKVYARFKDNIWAADTVEMESKNKNVKYLLRVIDVFKIVNKSNCKPNKLWVDQGREFYNKLMQQRLDNNHILMHSTHN